MPFEALQDFLVWFPDRDYNLWVDQSPAKLVGTVPPIFVGGVLRRPVFPMEITSDTIVGGGVTREAQIFRRGSGYD
jgi:hypothetical protein